MKIKIKWIVFCIVILSLFVIPQCLAQVSDLKIEVDPFQYENGDFKAWSNDMKKIGITTEERGLIYRITVSNVENEPITVEELTIQVRVERTDSGSNSFFDQIKNYIYLPYNEKTEIDIPVDFGHRDVIGSYRAEIQCGEGSDVTQNIEAYPSEFRVLSEDQFQKELEEKKGTLIDITINVIIENIVGVTITISLGAIGGISFFLYRRRQ